MTALLLLGLAVRDLAASWPGRRARGRWAPLGAAVIAVLAAALVLAAGPATPARAGAAALVGVGAVGVWHALSAASSRARVVALAGVVVVAVAEHTLHGPGGIAPLGLTVLAAGLALLETANVLTRDVLALAGRPSSDAAGDAPGAPAPRHALPAPDQGGDADDAPRGLQGGRFIGPMERLLMAALGLAQAWPVVAALMAAKGIVRFPEISRDVSDGEPAGAGAEEFLVGSLASWSLAAGGALLVHLALRG